MTLKSLDPHLQGLLLVFTKVSVISYLAHIRK